MIILSSANKRQFILNGEISHLNWPAIYGWHHLIATTQHKFLMTGVETVAKN
jgi:hypothetical protein